MAFKILWDPPGPFLDGKWMGPLLLQPELDFTGFDKLILQADLNFAWHHGKGNEDSKGNRSRYEGSPYGQDADKAEDNDEDSKPSS